MSDPGCGCCACLAGAGQRVEVSNRPGLSSIRYRIGTHATFLDAMIRRLTAPVDQDQSLATYSLHALRTREPDDAAIALLDAWATVGDVLTFYQERIANEAFLRTATERLSILELGRLVGYELKPGVAASVYLAYTLEDTSRTTIPAGTKAQSIPGANEQPQTFETSERTEARGAWNALRPRMSKPQEITLENVLDDLGSPDASPSIWVEGTTVRLEPGDPILFVFEASRSPFYALRRTLKTSVEADRKVTRVLLEPVRKYYRDLARAVRLELEKAAALAGKGKRSSKKAAAAAAAAGISEGAVQDLEGLLQQILLGLPRAALQSLAAGMIESLSQPIQDELGHEDKDDEPAEPGAALTLREILEPLVKPRAIAPATSWNLGRSLGASLGDGSDYRLRLLTAFYPQLDRTLYTALANQASRSLHVQFRSVHVLRRRAAVFGFNAPPVLFEDRPPHPEFPLPEATFVQENENVVHLDTPDEKALVGSYVVAWKPKLAGIAGGGASRGDAVPPREADVVVARVVAAETLPRTAYGVSGKTTRLVLNRRWWSVAELKDATGASSQDAFRATMIDNLRTIRNTSILAESEGLTLAGLTIDRPIGMPANRNAADSESETRIELNALVDGLAPGRWLIVSGERSDTKDTKGIVSAELVMIDNVEQQTDAGPDGSPYSILVLAPKGLAYQYKRDTVKISGNVVHATHGETRSEILGAGDATQAMQTFTLHHAPLTFVSAPTVAGILSTLAVRVNDLLWRRAESLPLASPNDRIYVTKTADDGRVSLSFGNGRAGARLPSGADNVRAVYRSGIGRGGNVRAGQIATAISRPLGIRDVVNPVPASGGADPESRDDARRNIPVALQAMGRVVSVRDYADFARGFAGIAKASAVALSDGRRRLVHLTIGGAGDMEIDPNSDLLRNLTEALREFGDRYQPFVVALREKMVMVGAARVRVDDDALWAYVAPNVRAALLDAFSYDRREFGQPIYPAEVVAAIQGVPGVAYVDLDAVGGILSSHLVGDASHVPRIDHVRPILPRLARHSHTLRPAQIAYLPAELSDLFILTEISP